LRRVLRLTEQRTHRDGQASLFPKLALEGCETTLELAPEEDHRVYADHGTHQQFHSEFKSDLISNACPRASSIPTIWRCRWRRWPTTCSD
jgi:hypothetical protein